LIWILLIAMGSKENEPQIKAPRVTPLEGVSTYALRGIGVRGVENPQSFGIDERRFVTVKCRHLSFSYLFASGKIRRVGFYGFGITIFQKP